MNITQQNLKIILAINKKNNNSLFSINITLDNHEQVK